VAACTVAALLSGCAVGPDFRRPATPPVPDYARPSLGAETTSAEIAGGEAQRFVYDQELAERWWTVFESPELNTLIERALNASPTLVAAQAALRQARALVLAEQGAFFPTLTGGFSASRQQASATLSPPLSTPELSFSSTPRKALSVSRPMCSAALGGRSSRFGASPMPSAFSSRPRI
jgi:outer membrane protein TolC